MLVYEEYFNAGVFIYVLHITIFTFATSLLHVYACTLEFQIERGRRNREEQGSWQISAKIIKGKGAINGEIGVVKISKVNKGRDWNKRGDWQNTAIRNFIEIRSSNDLVKISKKKNKKNQKKPKKYKGSLSTRRITSKPEPVCA